MSAQTKAKGQWGGRRANAGRKPKPPDRTDIRDPLEFLLAVMQRKINPNAAQLKAARAAAQYTHAKK